MENVERDDGKGQKRQVGIEMGWEKKRSTLTFSADNFLLYTYTAQRNCSSFYPSAQTTKQLENSVKILSK